MADCHYTIPGWFMDRDGVSPHHPRKAYKTVMICHCTIPGELIDREGLSLHYPRRAYGQRRIVTTPSSDGLLIVMVCHYTIPGWLVDKDDISLHHPQNADRLINTFIGHIDDYTGQESATRRLTVALGLNCNLIIFLNTDTLFKSKLIWDF